MLSLKNVSKSFGNIVAVEDLSFDIEEGEFVFLTGPSGSGKTTILRLLLRELLPDEGEILLQGDNILDLPKKKIPELRRNIGVVFQDFKLLWERTTRENIEVALAVIGLPQNEWKERVDHVLDLVGLLDRAELFPGQLSGGEMQRVSLARALVVNPKIVLADEPTGNLDWDTARELMDLFSKINKEGKTVLMATHHRVFIDEMKKREIVLEKPKQKKQVKEIKEERVDNEEKKVKKKKSKKKKNKSVKDE